MLGRSQPNSLWQQFTISILDVLNNFIINLLNVKSSDCIDLLSKLHTWAYSKIGNHFCFKSWTITSSEASHFGKDTICCSIEGPLIFVTMYYLFYLLFYLSEIEQFIVWKYAFLRHFYSSQSRLTFCRFKGVSFGIKNRVHGLPDGETA